MRSFSSQQTTTRTRRSLRWHSGRGQAGIIALIILVGLGLRLFHLGVADYWHDEIISTFLARVPAAEIFRSVTASDTHPPLYHILLHFWGALFGYDLIALRLFSVATSLLCIPLTYWLGRAVADPPVGVAAAALMALAPFQILHGQQARMYPLLTLVVLLALLSFLAAWRRGGGVRWAIFGLVAAAGFYTHVYFAFSLMALNLWALAESIRLRRIDWPRWAGLALAQITALALFSPFLLTMLQLTSSVVSDFWIGGVTIMDWTFALTTIVNNGDAIARIGPVPYMFISYLPVFVAALLTVKVARGARRDRPEERPAWDLLAFAVLAPGLIATTISFTVRPILLNRSLIGVSGPLFVLLAWATLRSWRSLQTRIIAAALMLSVAVGLGTIYAYAPASRGLDVALEYIFTQRQPGDAVIVLDWQSFDTTALLYPGAADVYVGTSEDGIAGWQRRMALMRWPTPEQVGPAEAYAGRYRRIWVLQTPYTYPKNWQATAPWLRQHATLSAAYDLPKIRVLLYEVSR